MEQCDEGRDPRFVRWMNSEMATGGEDFEVDDYDVENDNVLEDDQEETSKFETRVKSLPTEWTNETHSLYLKSIEASFVDQLYNNMGFPCFKPPKSHLHSSVRTSAGQFKTLRGGHWQKISVGEVQTDGHNTPTSLLSNPWIRHYRHSERYHLSSVCQEKDAAIDKEINSRRKAAGLNNPHRPVFTDNNTEASGQNFVNGDIMEGKRSSTQQLMI